MLVEIFTSLLNAVLLNGDGVKTMAEMWMDVKMSRLLVSSDLGGGSK